MFFSLTLQPSWWATKIAKDYGDEAIPPFDGIDRSYATLEHWLPPFDAQHHAQLTHLRSIWPVLQVKDNLELTQHTHTHTHHSSLLLTALPANATASSEWEESLCR